MKIDIYERRSGTVTETVDCEDMVSFRVYWSRQGNTRDYGFRIHDDNHTPFQRRVVKEPDGSHAPEGTMEFVPFNDDTCRMISGFNAGLTVSEVHHALMQGRSIYTNFHRYRLEA